jgi:hypothetical protein
MAPDPSIYNEPQWTRHRCHLIYKQDRLDFTEDLLADERDYTIPKFVTPRALDELLQNARDIDYN